MRADLRRRLQIGGLLVVIGAGGWYALRPALPVVGRAAPRAAAPATGAPASREEAPMPVRLDALEADRQVPVETARNPFRFQPKAAPAPPPSARPVFAPQRPAGEGLTTTPAPPPGPPPPPPIAVKFIGVVERSTGVKWAVLSDGRATLYGREGDIIGGQFRIIKIGLESIELAYPDGRGRQTVKLTGQ